MSRTRAPFSLPKPFRRRQAGFVCSKCSRAYTHTTALTSFFRTGASARPFQQQHLPKSRPYASIVSSPTSINAPVSIPERNKALYSALEALKADAGPYVNRSRLQLALRSLETTNTVTRIAILALNRDPTAAKTLAKLLLADPLGKEQEWERSLTTQHVAESQENAILLQYGEEEDNIATRDGRVLKTVIVNSRVLKRDNLEILIATLRTGGPTADPLDAILVPALASTAGTWLTYPVHRAVVLADGFQGVVNYGRMIAATTELPEEMVRLMVTMPASAADASGIIESDIRLDISLAQQALDLIRKDISNAVQYEHGWLNSGASSILSWLSPKERNTTSIPPINPSVRSLILSILSATRVSLLAESTAVLSQTATEAMPLATKHSLSRGLESWSERAHIELRDNLDLAFRGRQWRKLKWWKLFWRVDDVGAIASDILERRWLTDAEKGIIFVAGRLEEAGLSANHNVMSTLNLKPTASTQAPAQMAILQLRSNHTESQAANGKIRSNDNGEVLPPKPAPWPQHIPLLRSQIASSSIPYLQGLSQALVLQTLSTTALFSALSALTYVSFSDLGGLEAGAVGALGLTFALRKMQERWEVARDKWEGELREEGRKVLKLVKEGVSKAIEEDSKEKVMDEEGDQRQKAAEAIARVEKALSAMK